MNTWWWRVVKDKEFLVHVWLNVTALTSCFLRSISRWKISHHNGIVKQEYTTYTIFTLLLALVYHRFHERLINRSPMASKTRDYTFYSGAAFFFIPFHICISQLSGVRNKSIINLSCSKIQTICTSKYQKPVSSRCLSMVLVLWQGYPPWRSPPAPEQQDFYLKDIFLR
jgi:hypothetical protein